MFSVLLSFSEYLARHQTKYLLLNDELCIDIPILLDLNPVEHKYYQFKISLVKCTGRCDVLSS